MSENTAIRYVDEVTPGTTPTDDPGWADVAYDSANRATAPTVAEPTLIISDRMDRSSQIVDRDVGLTIASRLVPGMWDAFMAAAMHSDWATDVLKVNTLAATPHFSIETEYKNLTAKPFIVDKGMAINTMTITATVGETIQISFESIGMDSITAATTAVGIGSTAPVGSVTPLEFSLGMENIAIGGAAVNDLIVQGFDLTVTQTLRAQKGGGAPLGAKRIVPGMASVTGSLTAYWGEDAQTYYDDLQAGNVFDLDITVGNGTQSYQFDMPNCRLLDGQPSIPGRNSDIIPQFSFRALYDDTATTPLTITRVP